MKCGTMKDDATICMDEATLETPDGMVYCEQHVPSYTKVSVLDLKNVTYSDVLVKAESLTKPQLERHYVELYSSLLFIHKNMHVYTKDGLIKLLTAALKDGLE